MTSKSLCLTFGGHVTVRGWTGLSGATPATKDTRSSVSISGFLAPGLFLSCFGEGFLGKEHHDGEEDEEADGAG